MLFEKRKRPNQFSYVPYFYDKELEISSHEKKRLRFHRPTLKKQAGRRSIIILIVLLLALIWALIKLGQISDKEETAPIEISLSSAYNY